LVGLRFAQGLTAAAGIVIARAAVRDLYSGPAMARFFSMLMLVSGLAPILAPVIGGQVLRYTRWTGVFLVLAAFGVLLLAAVAAGLRETLPPHRRRPARITRVLGTYRRVATDRTFMAYTLSVGFVSGAMFAYIAGSPFVLQDVYGLSPQMFSLVFGANALGLMAAAQANAVLLRRLGPHALFLTGMAFSVLGGVTTLAAAYFDLGLGVLLPALFVVVAAVGVVNPNATALALADHGHRAGTASALLGVVQFLVGGLAAPLVGLGGEGSAVPMAAVVAGLAATGLVLFAVVRPTAARPGRYALSPSDSDGVSKTGDSTR
jgi:DHA1 family bicyclomycin/chloramphenicol resistance-like MFS transporter